MIQYFKTTAQLKNKLLKISLKSLILILLLVNLGNVKKAGAAAQSYQIPFGATMDICEYSVCKKVTNNNSKALSLFVPTNSSTEWSTFYGNLPSGVTTAACTEITMTALTLSGTLIVPTCWNNANNSIQCIGAGGGGGSNSSDGAGGGGGGGYSKSTNVTLTQGTVKYTIGVGGSGGGAGGNASGTNGSDSYFCSSTSNCATISGTAVVVGAKGGLAGRTSTGSNGGALASGVGSASKYSGGMGGNGSGSDGGGGGGGAGGPSGAGVNGSDSVGSTGASGGAGSNFSGGAGGASSSNGSAGSNIITGIIGSGGGGGGGNKIAPTAGGAGGNYGGGGGGGGKVGAGGAGSPGVCVIKYLPL